MVFFTARRIVVNPVNHTVLEWKPSNYVWTGRNQFVKFVATQPTFKSPVFVFWVIEPVAKNPAHDAVSAEFPKNFVKKYFAEGMWREREELEVLSKFDIREYREANSWNDLFTSK